MNGRTCSIKKKDRLTRSQTASPDPVRQERMLKAGGRPNMKNPDPFQKTDQGAVHLTGPTKGISNRKVTHLSSFLRYDSTEKTDVKLHSLPVKPGSIAEFLAMPGHRRPSRVDFADTAALYRYFEEHFVNGHITTPEGFRLEVRPGHLYSFIAGKRNGKSKGFIARARSADEALRMIREGAVSFEEMNGLEPYRMRNLPTYTDVLTDPDFSYRDGDKITYGKKYDDLHDADGFLAVTLQIDGELLHPVSFHPARFEKALRKKNLKWYMDSRPWPAERNALPTGKTSAAQAGDIDSIIPQNGPDVKGEKEKKN